MGSLEIYANIGAPRGQTCIVHLFSKTLNGMWPNVNAAASRAQIAMNEAENGGDLKELKERFTTKIQPRKNNRPRRFTTRSTSWTMFGKGGKGGASLNFAPIEEEKKFEEVRPFALLDPSIIEDGWWENYRANAVKIDLKEVD